VVPKPVASKKGRDASAPPAPQLGQRAAWVSSFAGRERWRANSVFLDGTTQSFS
jgi:hypothetical protein